MWLLIITTSFFAHSGSQDPTIYQFQEFKNQARCEQMLDWVAKREAERINLGYTSVQCIKNH